MPRSTYQINPQCSYLKTMKNYRLQEWATCYDCFQSENEGACLSCLLKCHRDHRIGPLRQSNFFCDCGSHRLCARPRQPTRPISPTSQPSYEVHGPVSIDKVTSNIYDRHPWQPVDETNALVTGKNRRLTTITDHRGLTVPIPPIKKNRSKPMFSPPSLPLPPARLKLSTTSPNNQSMSLKNRSNHWLSNMVLRLNQQLNQTSVLPVIYSPFSIGYLLMLVYLSVAGTSRQQIHQVLGLGNLEPAMISTYLRKIFLEQKTNQSSPLKVAHGVFYDYKLPVANNYITFLQGLARVDKCNFRSNSRGEKDQINQWVNQQTNRMIPSLLTDNDIDQDTRLVLVNAVYFKANWQYAFKKELTQVSPFRHSQQLNQVELMHLPKGPSLHYVEDDYFQLLELPYQVNRYRMGFFLPKLNETAVYGLPSFPSSQRLEQYWTSLRSQDIVEVYLPKFRADHRFSAAEELKKMGIHHLFQPGVANFGHLLPSGPASRSVYASDVIHQAVIIVDEQGTEAAAATAMICRYKMAPSTKPKQTIVFRADHPFHYYIRDIQQNLLIFVGRFGT